MLDEADLLVATTSVAVLVAGVLVLPVAGVLVLLVVGVEVTGADNELDVCRLPDDRNLHKEDMNLVM